jgi:sugar phosphate isomerase/epimerase
MKLGFMVYSLGRSIADGTLDFPGAIAHIAKCGAEGVDLDNWNTGGLPALERAKIVRDCGLAIASHISGADLTMNDAAVRAQGVDLLRRHADEAAEIGAPAILVTTGVCPPGQDTAEGRRNVADALAQLVAHAEPLGVHVCIEDFAVVGSPYRTAAECLEVCELTGPGLKMCFDSGNMFIAGQDPVEFLRAVAPRVVHAHAKDWELMPPETETPLADPAGRKFRGTCVGQGLLDYPGIIGALKAMDYQGFLAFEYEGVGDQLANALAGCAFLKGLMEG